MACVIGHNPSTADGTKEDPTTRWWNAWFQLFGFGGYVAVNLYPWMSPNPAEIYALSTGLIAAIGQRAMISISENRRFCPQACQGRRPGVRLLGRDCPALYVARPRHRGNPDWRSTLSRSLVLGKDQRWRTQAPHGAWRTPYRA
jgi:hypothetical protein